MFDNFEATETNTETTTTDPHATFMEAVRAKHTELLTTAGDNTLDTITTRFSGALPLRRLAEAHIVVIGCGGIGSPTIKNLVAMGAKNVTIIDDDDVEPQNVGTQFHRVMDLGMSKVDAMHDELLARYMIEVNPIKARVTDLDHLNELVNGAPIDILIGAVDNMDFRNTIGEELVAPCLSWVGGEVSWSTDAAAEHFRGLPGWYIDCRMSLGLWHVYNLPIRQYKAAMLDNEVDNRYARRRALQAQFREYKEEALFPPEEGMQEPCTARALGYTGENIASYVAALVDFSLREAFTYDREKFLRFIDLTSTKNEEVPFKWAMGFDARCFTSTMADPFTEKVKERLNTANKAMAEAAARAQVLEGVLSEFYILPRVPEDRQTPECVYTRDNVPLPTGAILLVRNNGDGGALEKRVIEPCDSDGVVTRLLGVNGTAISHGRTYLWPCVCTSDSGVAYTRPVHGRQTEILCVKIPEGAVISADQEAPDADTTEDFATAMMNSLITRDVKVVPGVDAETEQVVGLVNYWNDTLLTRGMRVAVGRGIEYEIGMAQPDAVTLLDPYNDNDFVKSLTSSEEVHDTIKAIVSR